MHVIRICNERIINTISLNCVFIRQFVRIIYQLVKLVFLWVLITYVNTTIKLWKVYVYPIGIFCGFAKKTAVFYNFSIDRVFKRVRIGGLAEHLVLLPRELNTEVPPGFGRIIAVA